MEPTAVPGGPKKHDFGPGNGCKNRGGKTSVSETSFLTFVGGLGGAPGSENGPKIDAKSMPKRS